MPDVLPYGRQSIDEADVAAVVEAIKSDWLTTGPMVERFEAALAHRCGAALGVAVCNGTAALHTAYHGAGIAGGDELIVPTITFAATANAAGYLGAKAVFVDVDPDTLLIDPAAIEAAITPRTKAIVSVDLAGQPCEAPAIDAIANEHGLVHIADGCHSLGGGLDGRPVGSLADATVFSFHPVKPITTGEGGAIVTDREDWTKRMRTFRNHGLTSDARERERTGRMVYDMPEPGYNYRLTDLQCALGLSQLGRLDAWTLRRQEIAARYEDALAGLDGVTPLARRPGVSHAYHLFIVRIGHPFGATRDEALAALRRQDILANIHYTPVHLLSHYAGQGWGPGKLPVAEAAAKEILSLPIFPAMTDGDVDRVVEALRRIGSR